MDLPILKRMKEGAKTAIKSPLFWARVAGAAIPLGFLAYVLYINYLPFGFEKTYTIRVGSENDTVASEFYLEPSKALSERKTSGNGSSRELTGQANAIFNPDVSLSKAEISVEVHDPGIIIIDPKIDLDPTSVTWDYTWDFSRGLPKDLSNTGGFVFDQKMYLDGNSRLEYASSSKQFESGPFTVYAKWNPGDNSRDFQQIIGHFNWELLQDKGQVKFMIGRVDDKDGQFYSVAFSIKDKISFFGQEHTAVAIYSPDKDKSRGYIELYVDGLYAGRTTLNKSVIWADYNGSKNLSIGKSQHGAATYYKGFISRISIANTDSIIHHSNKIQLKMDTGDLRIPLYSYETSTLMNITLYVRQD